MLLRLLAPLTLSLLHLAAVFCSGHVNAPNSAALTVNSVGVGSVRVTLPDRRSATGAPLAECVFAFETTAGGPATKEAEAAPDTSAGGRIDVVDVAAQLLGACVSSTSDYWTYELCFGRHVKQYRGADVYMLGRTQSPRSTEGGHVLTMEGGDMCDALNPPKARAVKLTFACKKNAQTPQLMSISETSTCAYELQVATDRVCSDDSFPTLANDYAPAAAQSSGGGKTHLEEGSEDWFMEMVELDSGNTDDPNAEPVVMCQVYSLEYRESTVTNLHFASAELRINKLQGGTGTNRNRVEQLPKPYRGYTARAPGRVDVSPAVLRVGYGALALDEQAEYDGSLSFLKVYA